MMANPWIDLNMNYDSGGGGGGGGGDWWYTGADPFGMGGGGGGGMPNFSTTVTKPVYTNDEWLDWYWKQMEGSGVGGSKDNGWMFGDPQVGGMRSPDYTGDPTYTGGGWTNPNSGKYSQQPTWLDKALGKVIGSTSNGRGGLAPWVPAAAIGIGSLIGALTSGRGGSSEQKKVEYNMTIPILDKRRVIGPGGQPIVQTAILGHYKLKPDGSVDTASVQHYKDPRVSTSSQTGQMDEEEERRRREAQGYARGGQVRAMRGPGGGLDDLIRARAGQQEIRLSNGEFVVPADVVSHLGDGSTDAGSQQLQAMIARVRQQKTGQQGQPRRVGIGALPR